MLGQAKNKNNNMKKISTLLILLFIYTNTQAQLSPISMEPGGNGGTWTWTTFENGSNPATTVVANPFPGGINSSANVIKFNALQIGNPWAGFESLHGAGIGTFTLNSTNSTVKIMVYKPIISDVGIKFATAAGASTGEFKVANTKINQWEELTFDFSAKIGEPSSTNIDQIIIFPDFNARTSDNVCYIDNINMGVQNVPSSINVKFSTNNTDSTPVYVFGNWNNWSNYPGVAMPFNSTTGRYETTLPMNAGSTIEYLYVNGIGTKEILNPAWTCTNGNAQYTNRLVTLGANDTTLCNKWQTCNSCTPLALNNFNNNNFAIITDANGIIILTNEIKNLDNVQIFTMFGQKIAEQNNVVSGQKISVPFINGQLYILKLSSEGKSYNYKITN
jgi:hypothetical protein